MVDWGGSGLHDVFSCPGCRGQQHLGEHEGLRIDVSHMPPICVGSSSAPRCQSLTGSGCSQPAGPQGEQTDRFQPSAGHKEPGSGPVSVQPWSWANWQLCWRPCYVSSSGDVWISWGSGVGSASSAGLYWVTCFAPG